MQSTLVPKGIFVSAWLFLMELCR